MGFSVSLGRDGSRRVISTNDERHRADNVAASLTIISVPGKARGDDDGDNRRDAESIRLGVNVDVDKRTHSRRV